MKITLRKLKKLIKENVLNENLNFEVSSTGQLKVGSLTYSLSSRGATLKLISIDSVGEGYRIVVKPPYIPFVSDGENKEGIITGDKLSQLKSNISNKLKTFNMTTKKGDNITFEKVN
jgi:hypothetical protein